MKHEDMRDKLSDYIDGSLADAEKIEIEAHLRSCVECGNALHELQKTVVHIRQLEEVEPPAWMTQKIMAKVRIEQEKKKSLFQRLFLPLHIKLPLEAVGLVFLAVTVFFVFRTGTYEKQYTEAPLDGLTAKQSAPASAAQSGEEGARSDKAPAAEVPQKQEYKALDMKQAYEPPPPPAPAPAPETARTEPKPENLKEQGVTSGESSLGDQRAKAAAPASPMAKKKSEAAPSLYALERRGNACLRYEPEVVAVNGIISKKDFPGPPNYEGIEKGETRETSWILKLEKAACVQGGSQEEVNAPESNVTEMQLVLDSSQFKQYQSLLGKRVTVQGTLFHSHTGHHHTPVLLTIRDIKPVP